jgi:hypothetical protein
MGTRFSQEIYQYTQENVTEIKFNKAMVWDITWFMTSLDS